MIIELHLIQNFAPANLNRDDTGSPKDCEFGGHRRARISSQCFKRAVRSFMRDAELVPSELLGVRTKLLVDEIAGRLSKRSLDPVTARSVAAKALEGAGVTLEKDKAAALVFVSQRDLAALTDLCETYWEPLAARAAAAAAKKPSEKLATNISSALRSALDSGGAVDLALFGRMLASAPDINVDGACQVAHAISTNRVSMEFDFYSAVDELQGAEQTGAGMLGTIEFNSSCFYRYANLDTDQLSKNLRGDVELARLAQDAFVTAFARAVPSSKQRSMAAPNPPSLVMAVARNGQAMSLANAFIRPARATRDHDLVQASISALAGYWDRLQKMYGKTGIVGAWAVSTEDPESCGDPTWTWVPSLDRINAELGAAAWGLPAAAVS